MNTIIRQRWNAVPVGQPLTPSQLANAVGITYQALTAHYTGRRAERQFPWPAHIHREGPFARLITRLS